MTDTASAAPSEQDLFERVFPMPEGCMRCGDTYAPTEYSAWSASAFIERFKGWQAARAQPTPPAVVDPLTDGQIARIARSVLETPVADGVAPAWTLAVGIARAIEAAHGIGIKKGDSHGLPT